MLIAAVRFCLFAVLQQHNGDVERTVDALIMQASLDDSQFPDDSSSYHSDSVTADVDALAQTVLSRNASALSTHLSRRNSRMMNNGAASLSLGVAVLNDSSRLDDGAALNGLPSYTTASGRSCEHCTFFNERFKASVCEMCQRQRLHSDSAVPTANQRTALAASTSRNATQPSLSLREIMDLELAQKLSLDDGAQAAVSRIRNATKANGAGVADVGAAVNVADESNPWKVRRIDVY